MLIHLVKSLPFTILLFCLVGIGGVVAQSPGDDGWMRIMTDDGEFSVEVPSTHRLFFNPDGFQVSRSNHDLVLKNMWMLSSVKDGALISFEVYDGSKRAVDALYDQDAFAKDGRTVTELKNSGVKIKQVVNKTDRYYSIRQFFSTKKHVYVLTAAHRTGEAANMRRFLDSVRIALENTAAASDGSVKRFSDLKVTDVKVEFDAPPTADAAKANQITRPAPDPTVKPHVMIRATRPSYIAAARKAGVEGGLLLRLHLAEDGSVPKLTVRRSLPSGLLRQALFAALRTKFLPREKDGVPVAAAITLEFTFDIY
jgi:TonB family protein